MNEFYNPSKSSNGGGYYQPSYEYVGELLGESIHVEIDDFNMGDFGEDYQVFCNYRGSEYRYDYSCDRNGDVEEYGDIPVFLADFIRVNTGYFCEF